MSGPLGFGAGGGGGDAVREVIAGSGITTSGTATSITVVNDGVRSLSGSGISVSSATGAVTITAPTNNAAAPNSTPTAWASWMPACRPG